MVRGKEKPATPSHTTKPCIWNTTAGLGLLWMTCTTTTTTTLTTTILLVGGAEVQLSLLFLTTFEARWNGKYN